MRRCLGVRQRKCVYEQRGRSMAGYLKAIKARVKKTLDRGEEGDRVGSHMRVPLALRGSSFLQESSRQRLGKPKVLPPPSPPPPTGLLPSFPGSCWRTFAGWDASGRKGAFKTRLCSEVYTKFGELELAGRPRRLPVASLDPQSLAADARTRCPRRVGTPRPQSGPQAEPLPGSLALHLPQTPSRHPRGWGWGCT